MLSRSIHAHSFHDFNNYLFGRLVGRWVNGATFFMLICITGVMFAGVGALFQQHVEGTFQISILCTLLFVYLITSRGIKALVMVNTFVVPIMIGFSLLIGLKTFIAQDAASLPALPSASGWMLAPLLYVSFNMTLALAVLTPLGSEADDKRAIIGGGIIGGMGLGILLFLANYALTVHWGSINNVEIPMAAIVSHFHPVIYWLFNLVILGEILTTLTGNIFGLTRQLEQLFPEVNGRGVIVLLLVICYAISQFGFSTLIHHLYPLFGFLSALTFIMIFIKETWLVPSRRRR